MERAIQTFIGCDNGYEESRTVIFGAPFDSTTSFRPGARFAPPVMRSESWGLETYSPYLDRDLSDIAVFDLGDLELPFGDPRPALKAVEDTAERIIADGKRPCMIGGEHLLTLGAVRAAAKKYGELRIIQFDAHTDLRQEYLGQELSHACVMRRCFDILGAGRIFQAGIRSGEKSEFQFADAGNTSLCRFNLSKLADFAAEIGENPVYVTIDLDVMDPSVFSGTGTPEPGGVSFNELRESLSVISGLNVVGMDLCELAPSLDASGASTAAACKILRELLLSV